MPKDDPANAGFMTALDPVNARADTAPGFVWRLIGDVGASLGPLAVGWVAAAFGLTGGAWVLAAVGVGAAATIGLLVQETRSRPATTG